MRGEGPIGANRSDIDPADRRGVPDHAPHDSRTLITRLYVKPIVLVCACRSSRNSPARPAGRASSISETRGIVPADRPAHEGRAHRGRRRERTKDSHGNLKRNGSADVTGRSRMSEHLSVLLLSFSPPRRQRDARDARSVDRSVPVNYHRHGFAYGDAGKDARFPWLLRRRSGESERPRDGLSFFRRKKVVHPNPIADSAREKDRFQAGVSGNVSQPASEAPR